MIILASNSDTRAKILTDFGIDFIQIGCDFDEEMIKAKTPKEFVFKASMGKYKTCREKFVKKEPILVADSVVTSSGQILRKAKNREDAKRILSLQSGNITSIITSLIYEDSDILFIDISKSEYLFDEFEKNDLLKYLDSNLWQGKAGACMIEGFCKKYIKEVRGLESTAMGLQIEKLLPFLKDY